MTIANNPDACCPDPVAFAGWLDSHSLLRKHLTPEVWHALKDVKTRSGTTLQGCIASGLTHSDSAIGVYAGDEESLDHFGLLFAPLIEDWHGGARAHPPAGADSQDAQLALYNPDPEGAYIRSTRIRLARNLHGYRLMPTITQPELLEVERLVLAALDSLDLGLLGSYQPLSAEHGDARTQGAAPHVGFDGTDRFQQSAGMCRAWPLGRGVFANHARSLQVWLNEEDHLRIISLQDGSDIGAVYARLLQASRQLELALRFQVSERYGYVASCPSNLGTGMRASFHIHLPLSGGSPQFRQLCARHGIAVRGAAGERGASGGALYDISNHRRWGISTGQCMQDLLDGTQAMIALERSAAH